jgi:hypothetical protein
VDVYDSVEETNRNKGEKENREEDNKEISILLYNKWDKRKMRIGAREPKKDIQEEYII